jgi:hypothetical protein
VSYATTAYVRGSIHLQLQLCVRLPYAASRAGCHCAGTGPQCMYIAPEPIKTYQQLL